MSAPIDARERYPATMRHSTTQSALVYERSRDMFALPRLDRADGGVAAPAPSAVSPESPQDQPVSRDSAEAAGAQLAFSLTGDDGVSIDVYRGPPAAAGRAVRPVYVERRSQRVERGSQRDERHSQRPIVPTGRVLVRFVEGVDAAARSAQLQVAGYRIVAVLGYAPHCVWVEAADGDPATALREIAALERLGDVVNVEPQWLAPRATR